MDLGTLGCKRQELTLISAQRGIIVQWDEIIWRLLELQAELDPGIGWGGGGFSI